MIKLNLQLEIHEALSLEQALYAAYRDLRSDWTKHDGDKDKQKEIAQQYFACESLLTKIVQLQEEYFEAHKALA